METLESIKYPMVPFGTVASLKFQQPEMLPAPKGLEESGGGLTPQQCMVYMVVQMWLMALDPEDEVYIAEDGTVWGKMTAPQLCHKLKVQFSVSLGTKSVQRRLRELASMGLLRREQLTKNRYDRAFYYSLAPSPTSMGQ